MTLHNINRRRARFGGLQVRARRSLSPEEEAIKALGRAVPDLEKSLGFALSVTAEAKEDGLIWLEVIIPDEHYDGQTRALVSKVLRDAAHPSGQFIYIEIDSDAPYA